MTDTDLCYLPASEAIKLFKAKKLSPVELMEATVNYNNIFMLTQIQSWVLKL